MGFDASYANGVFIKPTGAGAYTQIDIYGHNHGESDEGHDITSTLHGGYQAIVDSIIRGQATIRGHLTSDGYPWVRSIVVRGKGQIKIQYGNQKEFVMYYFISSVGYTNETAGGTDFEATFKMNAEATKLASDSLANTYVRPT